MRTPGHAARAAASPAVPRPVIHARKAWNSAILVPSRRAATPLRRHATHRHLTLPADVNPFLRIGPPHTGRRRALADFLLAMPP